MTSPIPPSAPIPDVPIDAQGNVPVTCLQCGHTRTASVMAYRDLHAPIGIECHCGAYFDIRVDTRRHYRQDVNLPGTYTPMGTSMALSMTVQNLSPSGVGCRMIPPYSFQVGDKLELFFQLDDAERTPIYTVAIVRWVQDEMVGAEFDHQAEDQSTLCLNLPS